MARVLSVLFCHMCILPSAVGLAGLMRTEQLKVEESSEMNHSMVVKPSLATTFRCVGGTTTNRSCLFRNLYFSEGRFIMYVTQSEKPKDEEIRLYRADKYEYPWRVEIKTFRNEAAIAEHLASKDIIEERGLSVQFNPLFHQNIGHALFDGLYPAFLATLKLGVQDRPWRPVVAVDAGCFDDSDTGKGPLQIGELVEVYVPHPKYIRTLRPIRAKVAREPLGRLEAPQCDWKIGLDHSGFVAGSAFGDRSRCMMECSKSFSCKAVVLFGGICYLKGEGGSPFGSPGRELCVLKESSKPKPNIVITPEEGQGVEVKEMSISQQWVLGRIRRRCMSEGVFETFGGMGEIRRLFELERDSINHPNLAVRFEEIVMGVGGAGNLIADKTGAIGGSAVSQNAMSRFRDRMLTSYGLDIQPQKNKPNDQVLNVIVVENKRFRPADHSILSGVIDGLNKKGNVHAELINWGRVGDADNKFKEQLRRVHEADVYISSIGTALQYVPFLGDGKVYLALGSVWMRSGRYFPTFMEQQLAGGGTPYLRTLYADPGAVLRQGQRKLATPLPEDGYYVGVDASVVWDLMKNAEKLVRQGFHIPVPVEDNLSVEAKVLVELCRRDASACTEMNEYRNGRQYECETLLWNEAVVYEVGPWREGGKCGNSHRKLLRQLRKEYGLPSYGAPEI